MEFVIFLGQINSGYRVMLMILADAKRTDGDAMLARWSATSLELRRASMVGANNREPQGMAQQSTEIQNIHKVCQKAGDRLGQHAATCSQHDVQDGNLARATLIGARGNTQNMATHERIRVKTGTI